MTFIRNLPVCWGIEIARTKPRDLTLELLGEPGDLRRARQPVQYRGVSEGRWKAVTTKQSLERAVWRETGHQQCCCQVIKWSTTSSSIGQTQFKTCQNFLNHMKISCWFSALKPYLIVALVKLASSIFYWLDLPAPGAAACRNIWQKWMLLVLRLSAVSPQLLPISLFTCKQETVWQENKINLQIVAHSCKHGSRITNFTNKAISSAF